MTAISELPAGAGAGAGAGGRVPYEALGRPIIGPSALTDDWRRFWHLTFNTAFLNWKLRFFGSALGYLWQLVRPLLLFAVLYVFFTKATHVDRGQGAGGAFYGSQLLASIVLFTFFGEATGGAVRSVVAAENTVRKIQFPRLVIPLSVVLLSMFNLSLNLVVVTVFALIEGVRPMLTWLELPLIVLVLTVLSCGVAMLLSALFVYFRDLEPIWEVVTQILFYGSPVIVPIAAVRTYMSPALFHVYMLSPLAALLQQFRHAYITHGTPDAATLLGSGAALLEPAAIVVGIFILGFWVFNRTAPRVAEDL